MSIVDQYYHIGQSVFEWVVLRRHLNKQNLNCSIDLTRFRAPQNFSYQNFLTGRHRRLMCHVHYDQDCHMAISYFMSIVDQYCHIGQPVLGYIHEYCRPILPHWATSAWIHEYCRPILPHWATSAWIPIYLTEK